MRHKSITRTWFVCLVVGLASQGNPLLAEEDWQETPGQPVNPLFEAFTAEESHGFMKNFVLNDALGTGRSSIWFGTHAAQVLPTAVVPNRNAPRMLPSDWMPQIGAVTATTSLGEMSLDQFLYDPESKAQGFIVIHKGRIVFEQYPGMTEADAHVTASAAKVFASLLVDLLIEEGKIDEQKTMGAYVPGFVGSAWEKIKVIDVIDMATGLDPIDGPEHFANPESVTARMLRAEIGEPHNGKVETMLEVMKEAKPVGEPGEFFTYSSTATQALALLTEAASGQTWADAFDQRIWSKMGVEGPFQVHVTPDGIAMAHGLLSVRLRDMARFGMLYTPSWHKIALEPVVTPEILKRTRVPYRSREFYRNGPSGKSFMERLGDNTVRSAGRQWDAVWDDGDFFKSGFNTQGIYVSPARDLVIAYFSVEATQQIQKYLRPLVTSGLFDERGAADNLKAFPPAGEGMMRHVLQLPKQEDESAFKLELIVGRTVRIDEANRYFFGGKIEARPISGWGYTCYTVSALGPMAGTLMAVDPDAPKADRFITLGGEPYLIRYNSRLPVVVYVPEGVEVRYRIWSAPTELKPIEKG